MKTFINYAHRGASEYAPENTLQSFYLGLQMQANGIETDVQLTKDNVAVLFHDETLLRVTGEEGSVSDYTLEELQQMKLLNSNETIPTFEQFLSMHCICLIPVVFLHCPKSWPSLSVLRMLV